MKYTHIIIGLFTFIGSTILGQTAVGTLIPTKNLDVNGDMRIRSLSGTIQSASNQLLTTDANGNVRQLSAYKNIAIGDIKYGMQKADHAGWYLLNGRNVNTLSATAKNNASTIGITVTLDNAQNKFILTGSTIGSTGGNSNQVLSLFQMPLYNITGTTSSSGNHSHTFQDQWYHDSGRGVTNGAILNNDNTTGTTDDRQSFTETSRGITTSVDGTHSHTISASSGGNGNAVSIEPPYLTANLFIYLGQ